MKLKDIPKSQFFFISIWFVFANLLGCIMIFRSIVVGESMDITIFTIAANLGIPAWFFFIDNNKYWRFGYSFLFAAGILRLFSKVYIKTIAGLSVSLCFVSIVILIFATIYFLKYRKVIKDASR